MHNSVYYEFHTLPTDYIHNLIKMIKKNFPAKIIIIPTITTTVKVEIWANNNSRVYTRVLTQVQLTSGRELSSN